jgi:hypothetical protein
MPEPLKQLFLHAPAVVQAGHVIVNLEPVVEKPDVQGDESLLCDPVAWQAQRCKLAGRSMQAGVYIHSLARQVEPLRPRFYPGMEQPSF